MILQAEKNIGWIRPGPQVHSIMGPWCIYLHSGNLTMENGPFEDVFPIKNGDIPLLW